MRKSSRYLLQLAIPVELGIICAPAYGATPTATPPYVLSTFATAPNGLSAPDSIAGLGSDVFVGYGDGHAPDGSDGLSSQVVEYDAFGNVEHVYTVLGHNDGLKVDPATKCNLDAAERRRQFAPCNHRCLEPAAKDLPLRKPDAAWRWLRRHRLSPLPSLHQRVQPRQQSEYRAGDRQRQSQRQHRCGHPGAAEHRGRDRNTDRCHRAA